MTPVGRVVLPLVVWAVVVPWLLATAATVVWGSPVGSDAVFLTLGTRLALVPLLLAGEVVGVVAVFRRYGGLRSGFWPGAGLVFALLSLFTVAAVAATWGEWGGILLIWALYTGYVFFVFFFGGMAWKKVFAWRTAGNGSGVPDGRSRTGDSRRTPHGARRPARRTIGTVPATRDPRPVRRRPCGGP